mmetsp:Transcript_38969/g.81535  ORF Transcript_38969/g.81535 Transcript_38969/m.81535 type:complete len:157 (-) Transcript_38969:230-700(-)
MNFYERACEYGGYTANISSTVASQKTSLTASLSQLPSSSPYELKCMKKNGMSRSPSLAFSSASSLSSQEETSGPETPISTMTENMKRMGSTLSRSRCVSNLSLLGGACDESIAKKRQIPSYDTGHQDGWGHYIDIPTSCDHDGLPDEGSTMALTVT